MKKTLYALAFTTLFLGTVLMSCKSSTKEEKESQENVLEAKENVQDAKDSLAVAKKAATAEEWKVFKQQADSTISDNETRIAVLKLKMNKTGESINVKYQENIEILEQKNKDLKVKVDMYQNEANIDWQSFKREFNHDMNDTGQALKNLTIDNKK